MFALLSDEELKEAYGDYRHRQGVEEGIEEGIEEGKISTLLSLVNDNVISEQTAADKLNISVEEFDKIRKEYEAKEPEPV